MKSSRFNLGLEKNETPQKEKQDCPLIIDRTFIEINPSLQSRSVGASNNFGAQLGLPMSVITDALIIRGRLSIGIRNLRVSSLDQ